MSGVLPHGCDQGDTTIPTVRCLEDLFSMHHTRRRDSPQTQFSATDRYCTPSWTVNP